MSRGVDIANIAPVFDSISSVWAGEVGFLYCEYRHHLSRNARRVLINFAQRPDDNASKIATTCALPVFTARKSDADTRVGDADTPSWPITFRRVLKKSSNRLLMASKCQ